MQVEEDLPVYVAIQQTPEPREANLREYLAAAKKREHLAAATTTE